MKWKSTLILFALASGLGAYLVFYDRKQPLPEEREQHAKHVLSIAPDTVTQLILDLPKGKTTLTRQAGVWRLAPNHLRADEALVNRILSQASALTAERMITASAQHPADLKAFGLDPAVGNITLVRNTASSTLLIGTTTPVGNNRYAKLTDRPEVFIVSSALLTEADQPAETFRDTVLLRFDAWSADALRITSSGSTLELTRNENQWSLTQPFADAADRSEVNALLSRLGGIAIKRVVNETPRVEDVASWGLDQPKAEIALVRGRATSNSPITIFIGKPLPDDKMLRYAKRSDEPPLYAVADADITAILKQPEELRAKTCFDFFTSNVTKVEVTNGSSTWAVERIQTSSAGAMPNASAPPNIVWRRVGSAEGLDAARVEQFLGKLADLRVAYFVKEESTASPSTSGTISVWTSPTNQMQRMVVGPVAAGSSDVYGRLEPRHVTVRLPSVVTELLTATPEQFRAPSSPPAPNTSQSPKTTSPSPSPVSK